MPKKKKDEEILSEITGITQQEALDSIQAANRAFSKEKEDSHTLVKENQQLSEKLKNVDTAFAESVEGLTKSVNRIKASSPKNLIKNPDGSVNWRKMVKSEYIVFNTKEYKETIEKTYGKPIGELTVDEVDDKYLLILLAGFHQVAKLRGYHSVTYPHVTSEPGFASVHCEIHWKPFWNGNEMEDEFIYGQGADCFDLNTDNFGRRFPTAIAFNRAFSRAVRFSLDIPILSKDEADAPALKMNAAEGERFVNPASPRGALQSKLNKMDRSVAQLGEWWSKISENKEALEWKEITDIPDEDLWLVMGEMKKQEEEKQKKK